MKEIDISFSKVIEEIIAFLRGPENKEHENFYIEIESAYGVSRYDNIEDISHAIRIAKIEPAIMERLYQSSLNVVDLRNGFSANVVAMVYIMAIILFFVYAASSFILTIIKTV
ncbi:hypothetical protein [Cerasicoccus maritimus]|uniref:hypothetical protein n=1 Tax=Cerasicoccus maritimus TaxID=490089 RepID=UPI0028528D7E|nr:hypothetical protein [Cerasicoccus maritimus]